MDKNYIDVDRLYQYLNIKEYEIKPRNVLNTGTLNNRFNIHYTSKTKDRYNLTCSNNINIKKEQTI